MPPPSAVAHAITTIPNRSSRLRTATSAPDAAKEMTPIISPPRCTALTAESSSLIEGPANAATSTPTLTTHSIRLAAPKQRDTQERGAG